MACGIFGKMPSKRDFVACNAPRQFLDPFETWLQSGIAASKNELGNGWQDLFLQAPIWRFWFGRNVCGVSVAGILMPSVDGIGRYFPLSAFATAPDDSEIASPLINADDGWYAATENLLLQTLEEDFNGVPEQMIAKMSQPLMVPPSTVNGVSKTIPGGIMVQSGKDQTVENLLTSIANNQVHNALAPLSFWWTIGGTDSNPRAMVFNGMPDVNIFSTLLDPEILNENSR